MIKMLYGFNDKENAIECKLENIELDECGAIYTAVTKDGGKIIAPASLFACLYAVKIETAGDYNYLREVEIFAASPEAIEREIELLPGEKLRAISFA